MELNRLRQVRHLLPGTARIIEVHSLVTHSKCDLETPTALVSSYRWHKGSTPSCVWLPGSEPCNLSRTERSP